MMIIKKRFINELSDHLNEQSFSTVNSTLLRFLLSCTNSDLI
ncbi:hypothetical protein VCA_002570 [Vibrio albensis VL426]|nr:hypothetical protein VCA_002570 [Vibrio cholerae VL426]